MLTQCKFNKILTNDDLINYDLINAFLINYDLINGNWINFDFINLYPVNKFLKFVQ